MKEPITTSLIAEGFTRGIVACVGNMAIKNNVEG